MPLSISEESYQTTRVLYMIAKISTDVVKALRSRELVERLKAEGSDPVGNSPDQFTAFLREETARWSRVIKIADIRGLQ